MIGVREEASEAAFLTRGGEGHGDDVGKNQMWVRKGGLETVDERRKGRGESWIGASVWIMAVPMGTGKGQGRVGRRLEARQARRTRASTRQGWGCGAGDGRVTRGAVFREAVGEERGARGWWATWGDSGRREDPVYVAGGAQRCFRASSEGPLFQSADRAGRLSGQPLPQRAVLAMIKRRAAAAGLPASAGSTLCWRWPWRFSLSPAGSTIRTCPTTCGHS